MANEEQSWAAGSLFCYIDAISKKRNQGMEKRENNRTRDFPFTQAIGKWIQNADGFSEKMKSILEAGKKKTPLSVQIIPISRLEPGVRKPYTVHGLYIRKGSRIVEVVPGASKTNAYGGRIDVLKDKVRQFSLIENKNGWLLFKRSKVFADLLDPKGTPISDHKIEQEIKKCLR